MLMTHESAERPLVSSTDAEESEESTDGEITWDDNKFNIKKGEYVRIKRECGVYFIGKVETFNENDSSCTVKVNGATRVLATNAGNLELIDANAIKDKNGIAIEEGMNVRVALPDKNSDVFVGKVTVLTSSEETPDVYEARVEFDGDTNGHLYLYAPNEMEIVALDYNGAMIRDGSVVKPLEDNDDVHTGDVGHVVGFVMDAYDGQQKVRVRFFGYKYGRRYAGDKLLSILDNAERSNICNIKEGEYVRIKKEDGSPGTLIRKVEAASERGVWLNNQNRLYSAAELEPIGQLKDKKENVIKEGMKVQFDDGIHMGSGKVVSFTSFKRTPDVYEAIIAIDGVETGPVFFPLDEVEIIE